MKKILVIALLVFMILPLISAGAGVKWGKETAYVPEGKKTCLTYSVYNPFPGDLFAKIDLSGEVLNITKGASSQVQKVPEYTSSQQAIPIEFCFKTPTVYQKDCLIANSLICEQKCTEDIKTFRGEVLVKQSTDKDGINQGGSKTQMSVSAPIKVKVKCVPHSRDYSVVYITIGLIALILLLIDLKRRKIIFKKK